MAPATYHPTHSRTLPPPDQGSEDNLISPHCFIVGASLSFYFWLMGFLDIYIHFTFVVTNCLWCIANYL